MRTGLINISIFLGLCFFYPQGAYSGWTINRLGQKVDFWKKIYTETDNTEGLLHDTKNESVVYERITRVNSAKVKLEKEKIRKALKEIAQGRVETPLARKIQTLFDKSDEPDKFLNAAHRKRLRFQQGQKQNFIFALKRSTRYLAKMEEVFAREGVPTEYTRLPFVESSFNLDAYSKVGASGIWQFMPYTAKEFLTVTEGLDERNDPLLATEAAAKLLAKNYSVLRSWPAAVTAYNHGRKAMFRAIQGVGSSNLEDLFIDYRGRSFGFASSNFFAQLTAVIELEKNADTLFKGVVREPPLEFFEAPLPRAMRFKDICAAVRIKFEEARRLNPAVTTEGLRGSALISMGYRFRTLLKPEVFLERLKKLTRNAKSS